MKQFLFILLILSLQQLILATEPIALISKIRGTVKHKMFSDRKYQTKLKLDAPILSDSQIRTNKNAFSKVVYLDDGTTLSIYPDSEIIIKGLMDDRKINKQGYHAFYTKWICFSMGTIFNCGRVCRSQNRNSGKIKKP